MNIYVGNLPYETSERELNELFAAFGSVNRVNIIEDRETGRSKGFAFVEMGSKEEGEKAIAALNGEPLGRRNLTVNEARPREERPRQARPRQDRSRQRRDNW